MRLPFFSMIVAALASAAVAAHALAYQIGGMALAFIAQALPPNSSWRMTIERALAADGPALAYSAPAPHYLRHEAGTARRGADRGT